jgi:hypothetical protein
MRHPFLFQPNLADDLHCLQASLGMTIEGMTGERVPMAVLENETGFQPGHESWAFGAMLALARRDLFVRCIEDFDPELFVKDPRAAILAQVHDASLVERAFEVSDVAGQVPVVRACIQDPRITFETRVPSLKDVEDALEARGTLIVNLNSKALNGEAGYSGHLVVVHSVRQGRYVIEDPGPPAKRSYEIDSDHFERSWKEPSEGLANLIAITTAPWKPRGAG